MQKVLIPEVVVPGFKIISSLNKEDIGKLTSFLKNFPVGDSLNNLNEGVGKLFDSKTVTEILKTLMSFTELLGKKDETIESVSKSLSESYKEMLQGNIEDDKIQTLENNLLEIFKSYKNLSLSLKAQDLLLENENNFHESRVISDLRLIFDDNLEEKKRYGVILHRLHLEYRQRRQHKDFYVSLDLTDLQQLKEEIERAIKKHEIIKSDYSDSINIIF